MIYRIHPSQGLVVTTWCGTVTDTGLLNAYTRLFRDKQWRPDFKQIADFRAADVAQLTSAGLEQLSEYSRGIETKRKTALIVQGDLFSGWDECMKPSRSAHPRISGFFEARRRR